MSADKKCDVCVVGGGPAGSTAAALLSKKGYDVLLLERAFHPRYSVGESLIPHFWRYASDSGALDEVAREGFVHKSGGTVCWKDEINYMAFKDFGYELPALHVERDRFDHILIENARRQGARVFEGASAYRVDLDSDACARVQYRSGDDNESNEIACRYVIDATGQRSLVSSQLSMRELDQEFRFCSVWGYFEDSKYVGPEGEVHDFKNLMNPPPTTFVTSVGDTGWSWHIPLRKSTSVGFVIPTADFRKLKTKSGSPESIFLQLSETTPILNRLLESARFVPDSVRLLRDYSYRSRKFSMPRCYLIGDAAAFIDPIYSVGVVLGMYSATVSAWAVDRSLKNADLASHSRAIFDSQLARRLELSRALALPQYVDDTEKHANVLLNQLAFESQTEKELFAVASRITDRSRNYTALVDAEDRTQRQAETKFQRLAAINW